MPNRRYDRRHQKVRKRWAPKVRAGKVNCARCGEPIFPARSGIWTTTTTIAATSPIWGLRTAAVTGRS
jgi:hypothetical protein